eukprot:jgi/Chlat1/4737/Chrsp300S00814
MELETSLSAITIAPAEVGSRGEAPAGEPEEEEEEVEGGAAEDAAGLLHLRGGSEAPGLARTQPPDFQEVITMETDAGASIGAADNMHVDGEGDNDDSSDNQPRSIASASTSHSGDLVESNYQQQDGGDAGMRMRRRKLKGAEVFVGGLDVHAKEDDVRRVFETVGEIAEVRLCWDHGSNKNKGFAFVRYTTIAAAKQAVAELDKATVLGKAVGVLPSDENDTLFVGKLKKDWDRETVKTYLNEMEGLVDIIMMEDPANLGRNRGFCFVEFETRKHATQALRKLEKAEFKLGDQVVKVAWAQPLNEPDEDVMAQVKSVFVDCLPTSWSEERVREVFGKFGHLERVVMAKNLASAKRKEFAFVNYTERESALKAIDSMNGLEISEGGKLLRLKATLAKPMRNRPDEKKESQPRWGPPSAGTERTPTYYVQDEYNFYGGYYHEYLDYVDSPVLRPPYLMHTHSAPVPLMHAPPLLRRPARQEPLKPEPESSMSHMLSLIRSNSSIQPENTVGNAVESNSLPSPAPAPHRKMKAESCPSPSPSPNPAADAKLKTEAEAQASDAQAWASKFRRVAALLSRLHQDPKLANKTPLSLLHEHAAKHHLEVQYNTLAESQMGPFEVTASICTPGSETPTVSGVGRGRAKAKAKQEAAAAALEKILDELPESEFLRPGQSRAKYFERKQSARLSHGNSFHFGGEARPQRPKDYARYAPPHFLPEPSLHIPEHVHSMPLGYATPYSPRPDQFEMYMHSSHPTSTYHHPVYAQPVMHFMPQPYMEMPHVHAHVPHWPLHAPSSASASSGSGYVTPRSVSAEIADVGSKRDHGSIADDMEDYANRAPQRLRVDPVENVVVHPVIRTNSYKPPPSIVNYEKDPWGLASHANGHEGDHAGSHGAHQALYDPYSITAPPAGPPTSAHIASPYHQLSMPTPGVP